jgi:hypothetical protein
MTANVSLLRLQDAWRECERNMYHLCGALIVKDVNDKWQPIY